MLTDIKLKEKFGKLKTDDRESVGVGFMVPDPRIEEVEPSANVTDEGEV